MKHVTKFMHNLHTHVLKYIANVLFYRLKQERQWKTFIQRQYSGFVLYDVYLK